MCKSCQPSGARLKCALLELRKRTECPVVIYKRSCHSLSEQQALRLSHCSHSYEPKPRQTRATGCGAAALSRDRHSARKCRAGARKAPSKAPAPAPAARRHAAASAAAPAPGAAAAAAGWAAACCLRIPWMRPKLMVGPLQCNEAPQEGVERRWLANPAYARPWGALLRGLCNPPRRTNASGKRCCG